MTNSLKFSFQKFLGSKTCLEKQFTLGFDRENLLPVEFT
jgi:hypothetical protein